MKLIIATLISLFLLGCGPISHKTGDSFYTDLFASGSNPNYRKEGTYNGMDFYVLNPYWKGHYNDSGLLVMNGKVVKSLSQSDVDSIRKSISDKKIQDKNIADQNAKQQQIKSDLAEQKRINELKSRKYSILPAKLSIKTQSNGWNKAVIVTSVDDEPFLLERVVVNNRVGVKNCDNGGYVEYFTTGDSRSVPIGNCGDSIVKVDVYTNRGSSSYNFKGN